MKLWVDHGRCWNFALQTGQEGGWPCTLHSFRAADSIGVTHADPPAVKFPGKGLSYNLVGFALELHVAGQLPDILMIARLLCTHSIHRRCAAHRGHLLGEVSNEQRQGHNLHNAQERAGSLAEHAQQNVSRRSSY